MHRPLQVICLLAALFVGGCLSMRARSSRLADIQIARIDALVKEDPAHGTERAIRAYSRFLHGLSPYPAMDATRSRILLKRGEVYRRAGREDLAQSDFQRAKEFSPESPGGVPTLPLEKAGRSEKTVSRPGSPAVAKPTPVRPQTFYRACNQVQVFGMLPIAARIHRDSAGLSGSVLDLPGNLKADAPFGAARFAGIARVTSRLSLGFEGLAAVMNGSSVLEEPVMYDGTYLPAGVDTDSEFRILDLGLHLRAVPSLGGPFRLAVDVGFRYIGIDSRLRTEGISKEDTLDAFFPVLGLSLTHEFPTSRLRFVLDVRGAGLFWAQGETTLESVFLELVTGLEFDLLPRLSLGLGIRGQYVEYGLAREGLDKGMTLATFGPAIGMSLRL
ncbi:MAG: hypothetical protein ACYTFG_04290 [Planctomycetota bacterium]|jgi:hypothetical protein